MVLIRRRATTEVTALTESHSREEMTLLRDAVRDALAATASLDDLAVTAFGAHDDGLVLRPIREMTGSDEFCEVYFDGAVRPPDSVLGELNQGWAVANSGQASERAYVGANAVMLDLLFDDLVELKIDGQWRFRRGRCQFLTTTGLSDLPQEKSA